MLLAQRELGIRSGINVGNPIPLDDQLDPSALNTILERAWSDAETEGITGQETTPYLLDYIRRATDGKSLEANVALYRNNIKLGVEIARAIAEGAQ